MKPEDIKMGGWYRYTYVNGSGGTYTPISTECDQHGRMAFREERGHIFTASVTYMKPVVYPEVWIVMGRWGARGVWDSLEDAEYEVDRITAAGLEPDTGILHVRPDLSTEMLEIKKEETS